MRIFRQYPSQEYLHSIYSYNEEEGLFYKKSDNLPVYGGKHTCGYRQIMYKGRYYLYHRMVWTYHNGDIQVHAHVDHLNGIRDDNRIENIRLCSGESENNQNKAIYRNNTSGYTGVSFDKKSKKWIAQIKKNKKNYYLGYYSNPEDAYEAYKQAKLTMHEYHPGSRTTKCNYVDHRQKHSMLASKNICLLPSDSACFQDGDGVQKNINQSIKGISTMPTKQVQSMGGRARAEALSPSERSSIAAEGGNARKQVLSPERRSEIASKGGKSKGK